LLAEPTDTRLIQCREVAAAGNLAKRLAHEGTQVVQDLRSRLGCDSEGSFRLGSDGAKGSGIVHSQVGQHLAIDLNLSLQQAIDQPAVGQSVQTRCGVDTRDPERAELALLLAAIPVCVLTSLDDCLLGGAIDLAAGVVVALRLAKNFL